MGTFESVSVAIILRYKTEGVSCESPTLSRPALKAEIGGHMKAETTSRENMSAFSGKATNEDPRPKARASLRTASPNFISRKAIPGAMALVSQDGVVPIIASSADWAGVKRAAAELRDDFKRVCALSPSLVYDEIPSGIAGAIIIGTLGRNPLIDGLVSSGTISAESVEGHWEAFRLTLVDKPFPGVPRALVVMGADKRGAIFGIFEISRAIGVSPWHFWADVPIRRADALYALPKTDFVMAPAVKYRGIFLNDEYPALTRWVANKFGPAKGLPDRPAPEDVANYGKEFYTKIFDLLLRLRANYLWPAMWNNAFNEDDPDNARLADEYGIVMGNSHQEPMLRAQKEWDRRYLDSVGHWDYSSHPELLEAFWREGVERNKDYESIVTIGLRGADDTEMMKGGPEASRKVLETIVQRQRKILEDAYGKPAAAIPQLWCLYKEVQEYYESGMRVPDDVTLLWAEDNWGNQRRLPTAEERSRSGGAGIYYHFDYHGGPRSYQWINTSPISRIWDQMSLAYQYGADRVWIVNVGHFKGYEYPIAFFTDLAWDPERFSGGNLDAYSREWLTEQFPDADLAWIEEAASVLDTLARYNGRRKPELLAADTYSLIDYREAERVLSQWWRLRERAEKLAGAVAEESMNSYYELILFPVRASALLGELYIAAGLHRLYLDQSRASAVAEAIRVRHLFARFQALMDDFNERLADGKWRHFMDQAVLGYVAWNDPPVNNLNHLTLTESEVVGPSALGVAIEGSSDSWPLSAAKALLPPFDAFNRQSRYIELFNRGQGELEYKLEASEPWVIIDHAVGKLSSQKRIELRIDWERAPLGKTAASVKLIGGAVSVIVELQIDKPAEPPAPGFSGFVEIGGVLAMEAEHYARRLDAAQGFWEYVAGFGKTLSGLRATTIVDTPPFSAPSEAPCLEYDAWFYQTGKATVELVLSPVLNFIYGRDVRIGVSVDDGELDIITVVPGAYQAVNGNADWEESVRNAGRFVRSTQLIRFAGAHTIKVWLIDPGPVLERVLVDVGGLKRSYFGPPESFFWPSQG